MSLPAELGDVRDVLPALIGAGTVVAVAGVGGIVRLFCGRLDKIEKQITDVSGVVLGKIAVIELNNNQRHEENIERLTRLETTVNGYPGRGRKTR